MATNFPTSLDALTNPTSSDSLSSPSHSAQHANVNDAVEALQAKVGADSSAVTTSLDYKVAQLEAISHGKILQVVSTHKNDVFSTTSTSMVNVTGLEVTITPSSTSSKIFITGVVSVSGSSAADTNLRLTRNGTSIFQSSLQNQIFNYRTNQTLTTLAYPLSFLDSPNTTSATTYQIQMRVTSGTGYINRRAYDDNRSVSGITVMEVSA